MPIKKIYKDMSINPVNKLYIKDIVSIEESSFPKDIQEDEQKFLEIIEIFPEGFFLAIDKSINKTLGYIYFQIRDSSQDINSRSYNIHNSIKKHHNSFLYSL